MQLKTILVKSCFESKTNPRGQDFEDKEFEELKASIQEKGILVPVLVRETKNGTFEVIAGARRLRAAKQLKLEEIPAKIVEMNDEEALEAQIIENLQRKDIHPIEEGLAYRVMRENKMTSKEIADKIGKSERYVSYRLNLTNLIDAGQKAFRSGKINDGLAVLISDLAPHHQKEALKFCLRDWDIPTAKELKEWIVNNVYEPLKNQPWLNKGMEEIVGPCVECPPSRQSLFGDVKEGACTDLRCWNRKMNKYINYQIAEYKKEGIDLVQIKLNYGNSLKKGVLTKSQYEPVSKKCGHEVKAIVVEDEGMGEIKTICIDEKCPVHGKQHTEYKASPAEKAKKKEERLQAIKEKEAEDKKLLKKLDKITAKNILEHLDVLVDLTFEAAGYLACQRICKRHGIEVEKREDFPGSFSRDYSGALKKLIKESDNDSKTRFVFEMLIDNGYSLRDEFKKI
jgi:ParB family chromosome partitioning protein